MQSGLVKNDGKKKQKKKNNNHNAIKYFHLAQSRFNKIIDLRQQMAFARLGL